MSDQSQPQETPEMQAPVAEEAEVVIPPEQEGMSEYERLLDEAVKQRVQERRNDLAKQRATDRRNRAQRLFGTREDSTGDTEAAPDVSTVPPVETPAPEETEAVVPGQAGSEAPSITPPSTTPPSSEAEGTGGEVPPASEPFKYVYHDVEFDEPTVQSALELLSWRQTLSEQGITAINALLSGSHILVSKEDYAKIQSSGSNVPSPTPAPAPSTVLTDDQRAELDPAIVSILDAHQAELEEIKQRELKQQEYIQQQQAAQWQQQLTTGIQAANASIRTKYALTDEEFAQLETYADKSGLVVPLFQKHQSVQPAVEEALEINYLRHFYQRELTRQAQLQLAAQQSAATEVAAQQQQTNARKANASKISPAGNVSPANVRPAATKEERRAATVAEVQALLAQH